MEYFARVKNIDIPALKDFCKLSRIKIMFLEQGWFSAHSETSLFSFKMKSDSATAFILKFPITLLKRRP